MQREYMHFYKGYWVVINLINKPNCKLTVEVQYENHRPIASQTQFTNRKEAKEWAESYLDVVKSQEPILESIPF